MCSPVRCRKCGKTTWSGCGQHIDAVKRSVPADQWCDGRHDKSESSEVASSDGFFSRLFNR